MLFFDQLHFSALTIRSHPLRSALTALGLIIGIASVVILTSIGQGVHQFVLAEFTQFGSHLLGVYPGKTSTFGMSGATISTVRPLTQADALSLEKMANVRAVVSIVQGNAKVEAETKQRRTTILGVSSAMPTVWKMQLQQGRFFSQDSDKQPRSLVVLGSKVRDELFPLQSPLGQRVRIGADRYRVVGVMASKGQFLGFDMDDTVYIPTGKALQMFNREGLMEINVLYKSTISSPDIEQQVKQTLIRRHGQEDFTIITQDQMLETLNSILNILTLSVAALGGISLFVGAVGILTIMMIALTERVAEIGLLRALGASETAIFQLFLIEALALSLAGGACGVALGIAVTQLIKLAIPALPLALSWLYIIAAFIISIMIGAVSGVLPAIKAAKLEPIQALRSE